MGRKPYLGRWGRLSPADKEIVDRSIALLGLEKLARRPITAISGGEAQRAVLARTLAQDAKFSLLDEPTASLDVAHGLELMAILTDLARSGRGIVVVSHDLALAASWAQELVLLKDGVLAASGPLGKILTSETLERVFEAEAQTRPDDFAGGLAISFRLAQK
jgi:iron complex transport system ATP-binding protein